MSRCEFPGCVRQAVLRARFLGLRGWPERDFCDSCYLWTCEAGMAPTIVRRRWPAKELAA